MADPKFQRINKTMNKKEPSVYLIRHGSTDFNNDNNTSQDRIRGWIDVPLNAEGHQQAKDIAKSLQDKNISKIYSSDLTRAKQTADHISNELELPVQYEHSLRPWNLGEFQGQSSKNVTPQINKMIEDETGPKSGEEFGDFRKRFLGKLKGILNESKATGQNIAVVAHYRNLKTADAWQKTGMPPDLSIDKPTMIKNDVKTGDIMHIPANKKLY